MRETQNGLSGNVRGKSIELLADGLMQLLDLERQAKLAHWNVKGTQFIALHELFDRVATEIRDLADTVAERLVSLGGVADARSQAVAASTRLPQPTLDRLDGPCQVASVASALALMGNVARDGISQSDGWGDAATGDIFTEVSRSVDKQLWLVEAHQGSAAPIRASA